MKGPVAFGLGSLTTISAGAILIYGMAWIDGSTPPNITYLLFSLLLPPLGASVYWIAEVNLDLKYTKLQAFSLGVSSLWVIVFLAKLVR